MVFSRLHTETSVPLSTTETLFLWHSTMSMDPRGFSYSRDKASEWTCRTRETLLHSSICNTMENLQTNSITQMATASMSLSRSGTIVSSKYSTCLEWARSSFLKVVTTSQCISRLFQALSTSLCWHQQLLFFSQPLRLQLWAFSSCSESWFCRKTSYPKTCSIYV